MLTHVATHPGVWHARLRRWRLPGLVLLSASVLVGSLVLAAGMLFAARPEPWPAFRMVYTDTASDLGSGRVTVQTFRLDYRDQRHFTSTLLAHSDRPESLGWTHTVDGRSSTIEDPAIGTTQAATFGPDELTVPADWLFPGARPRTAWQPGATIEELQDGLVRATHITNEGGREIVEQTVYRQSDGIPMLFTQAVDGRETRRVEVLELKLLQAEP